MVKAIFRLHVFQSPIAGEKDHRIKIQNFSNFKMKMLRIVSLLNIILGRKKSSLKYNDRPDEFIDHPVSLRKSFYDTNISFICTVSEIKKAFLNQWVFKNAKANIICKVKYTLIIFKDVYLPCCVKLVCR